MELTDFGIRLAKQERLRGLYQVRYLATTASHFPQTFRIWFKKKKSAITLVTLEPAASYGCNIKELLNVVLIKSFRIV